MPRFTGFSEKFFLKKRNSEIWAKTLHFSSNLPKELDSTLQLDSEELDSSFGEIRFSSSVMYIINSNSWFLAVLKRFSEGLPLFKLTFFS